MVYTVPSALCQDCLIKIARARPVALSFASFIFPVCTSTHWLPTNAPLYKCSSKYSSGPVYFTLPDTHLFCAMFDPYSCIRPALILPFQSWNGSRKNHFPSFNSTLWLWDFKKSWETSLPICCSLFFFKKSPISLSFTDSLRAVYLYCSVYLKSCSDITSVSSLQLGLYLYLSHIGYFLNTGISDINKG